MSCCPSSNGCFAFVNMSATCSVVPEANSLGHVCHTHTHTYTKTRAQSALQFINVRSHACLLPSPHRLNAHDPIRPRIRSPAAIAARAGTAVTFASMVWRRLRARVRASPRWALAASAAARPAVSTATPPLAGSRPCVPQRVGRHVDDGLIVGRPPSHRAQRNATVACASTTVPLARLPPAVVAVVAVVAVASPRGRAAW